MRLKIFLMSFLILWMATSFIWAECKPAQTMEDVYAATCRVECRDGNMGSRGTGAVVMLKDGLYYIVTNYHVVTKHKTARLDFFRDGLKTSVTGRIVATFYNEKAPYDFAIITVPESDLADYAPPFLPLAPKGYSPDVDRRVLTCGCAEGTWAKIGPGRGIDYYGNTFQFSPAVKPGQSGSPITVNVKGVEYWAAIVTWRIGDNGHTPEEQVMGGAIPVKNLYNAIEGVQPSGELNSIPPNAEFCSIGIPPNAKIAIEYVTDPNVMDVNALEYYLFMVSSDGCSACESAKPILEEFRKQGEHHVQIVDPSHEKYAKLVESLSISQFPTFIWGYYDKEHHFRILNQWSGTEELESRLQNGLTFVQADPIPDDVSEDKGESTTDVESSPESTSAEPYEREPSEEETSPSDVVAPEVFYRDTVVPDDFDRSIFAAQGYGNQDAEPLLREYGNGWQPDAAQPELRQPLPKRRPWSGPETELQNNSGIVPRMDERVILPRILSPLLAKVEMFFDQTYVGIMAMVRRGITWTVLGAIIMIVATFYLGVGISQWRKQK